MDLILQIMAPNKDWMMARRLCIEYLEGIESFFEFIIANKQRLGAADWYFCPCVKCRNVVRGKKILKDIRTHLICDGIDKTYTAWTFHGEAHPQNRVSVEANNSNEDELPRIKKVVMDGPSSVHNDLDSDAVAQVYMWMDYGFYLFFINCLSPFS